MKKVNTAQGYDFWIGGLDGQCAHYYNITPEGTLEPDGGYFSAQYIANIKHVPVELFLEAAHE